MMSVSRVSLNQSSNRFDSSRLVLAPMRWLTRIFGCWHKMMSPPFTRNSETYCTCMTCGARRQFNVGRGKMTGAYYFASPSALYEPPAPQKVSGDPKGRQPGAPPLKRPSA